MANALLFDPLFRTPFVVGLALALALSLTGALLRMREEWLAALALSQVSAVGAILAVPLGIPVVLGAFVAALLAFLLQALLSNVHNNHHAALVLLGWAGTLLAGSYVDHGQVIGETLLRGQLYFTHKGHLIGAVCLLGLLFGVFPWLSPRLLITRFFPDHYSACQKVEWPHKLVFAIFVISSVVLGTVSIGVFPTFAMLFFPSWMAFVLIDGWRRSIVLTGMISCFAYILAFILAIQIDLPFGPVLVAVLALLSCFRCLAFRR